MPFLSWAKPTPSQIPRESPTRMLSPSRPTLKPSYSQVVKPRKVACDPEKLSCAPPCDASHGPLVPKPSCDLACDPSLSQSCAPPSVAAAPANCRLKPEPEPAPI